MQDSKLMWSLTHSKRLGDYIGIGDYGIFENMSKLDGFISPWGEEMTPRQLDMLYVYNQSGDKSLSPLVLDMIMKSDTKKDLTTNDISTLSSLIYNRYRRKWAQLWETVVVDYNPISNYDMSETVTTDGTSKLTNDGLSTDNFSEGKSVTDTFIVDNSTTSKSSGESIASIFGFNSEEAVPEGNDTTGGEGSSTDTRDEKRTVAEKTNNTLKKDTFNQQDGTTHQISTTKRSGNIGVTTSQQMITAERDVREWDFFEVVFNDVDNILTIGYSSDYERRF